MKHIKAMIFAAGLGTRMRPLTDHVPKALIRLNEKPLIWYAIQKLLPLGIDSLVVNVHHHHQQLKDYFNSNNFGIPVIISDESEQLLDTGGGLFKAREWLHDADELLLMNTDILSTVDLQAVIDQHRQKGDLASLVVRQRDTSRYLLFNEEMLLSGWENRQTGARKIARSAENTKAYAFSGIQVVNPQLLDMIEEAGKFSLIDVYLRLAQTQNIRAFVDTSAYWIDVGKPGELERAEKIFNNPSIKY